MVRTQIQLTDEQADKLKRLAAKKNKSIAELIRRGVDVLLRSTPDISSEEQRRRAVTAVGRFRSGQKDLSSNHDKYLSEVYSK